MIDKSNFHCAVKKNGDVIAIRVTGDGSCLWLNMYLDLSDGQMTCDSDVGFYAYRVGRVFDTDKGAIVAFCNWLKNRNWLLRKCVNERCCPRDFDYDATIENLRKDYKNWNNSEGLTDFETAVCESSPYSDDKTAWETAFQIFRESNSVELHDEWWECIVERYTPRQERFAEICREVIVQELRKFVKGEGER